MLFFCVIATLFIIGLRIQRARHSRAQGTLRQSEERYLLALESSTDGLWDWNILSDTVFYSDRFREILGYSSAEFPGTIDSLRNRIHPEDTDAAWTAIQRHLKERIPFNIELRLRTKAGAYLWIFFAWPGPSGIPPAKPSGCPDGFRDITERKQAELDLQAALSDIKQLKKHLEAERAYLQEEIKFAYNYENIIGQSDEIKYVLYKVEQIAASDTTVLVLGETGTGKELVARAIHSQSLRKNRALVKINCATLPANLIESELFGHEKGAFTGAHARQLGRFEVANGATIFLDEIGELPLELQPKLLRVIQDGEFERLGQRPDDQSRCAGDCGHQPPSGRGGPQGSLPGRSLVPAECFSDYRAPATLIAEKTFPCWSIILLRKFPSGWASPLRASR